MSAAVLFDPVNHLKQNRSGTNIDAVIFLDDMYIAPAESIWREAEKPCRFLVIVYD